MCEQGLNVVSATMWIGNWYTPFHYFSLPLRVPTQVLSLGNVVGGGVRCVHKPLT